MALSGVCPLSLEQSKQVPLPLGSVAPGGHGTTVRNERPPPQNRVGLGRSIASYTGTPPIKLLAPDGSLIIHPC